MREKTLLILLIVMLLAAACSSQTIAPPVSGETENKSESTEPEIPQEDPEKQEAEDNSRKVISPLDGLKYYPEELSKRPVAVSIDNHPSARWQAGLSQAEIVYEFEVEHPYTRYLCIFLAKEPEMVGPVRSARPYIIYYALENDGIFVHVGGSQDAFNEIAALAVPDIDGLYSGAMQRYYDTGKVAPHNMYTTLKAIRSEAESRGYRTEGSFEGYKFNEETKKLSDVFQSFTYAKKISITYNRDNSTDYEYDSSSGTYKRFKDGEMHIDELDDKQLCAKNIIVIETSKSVLDNAGRLYLGNVGEGKGFYMTEGQSTQITWKKASKTSRTRFYANGNEILLNPGNTWIQVVSNINSVSVSAE
ncbi:MAG: DUF3048 domain-containing protein [Sedimentibacter sp.]|uniref:DUF3048 domain-containing protein n=1 Tax=Sedimentibacter sp. TaxID=1960295 RepID=UPI0031589EC0